jgi:dimethylargininase
VIPADESHPDCCFLEDTLVCARGTALLTHPGHPSRQGEVAGVKAWLEKSESAIKGVKIKSLQDIDKDATLDGGDVLFTGRHMFVGLTARYVCAANNLHVYTLTVNDA